MQHRQQRRRQQNNNIMGLTRETNLNKLRYLALQKHQGKLPGIGRVAVTGQYLTMEIYGVVVVEESECSDFKALKTSDGIVVVIKRCISWASVGKMLLSSRNVKSDNNEFTFGHFQFMSTF